MSLNTPLRDDRVGLGEDGAAGVELGLARQAALRRVVAAGRDLRLLHGSMSFSRRRAMRSTWAQAVANSVGAVVADAGLEGGEDVGLVEAAHGDDEGEAELRDVGVVELGEAGALGVGQGVEAGAGLLGGRFRRSGAWRRRACRRGRGGRSARRAARPRRRSGRRGRARCAGRSAVSWAGPSSQGVGALGDPGRVLEDAAEAGDEVGAVHAPRGAGAGAGAGWRAGPVAGDVDAARDPDLVVALDVVDEAGERGGAAGAADQPAVQADRHHLRAARPRPRRRGCRSCP